MKRNEFVRRPQEETSPKADRAKMIRFKGSEILKRVEFVRFPQAEASPKANRVKIIRFKISDPSNRSVSTHALH